MWVTSKLRKRVKTEQRSTHALVKRGTRLNKTRGSNSFCAQLHMRKHWPPAQKKRRLHDKSRSHAMPSTCAVNKAIWFEHFSARGFWSGHPPASCTEKCTLHAVRKHLEFSDASVEIIFSAWFWNGLLHPRRLQPNMPDSNHNQAFCFTGLNHHCSMRW